MAPVDGGQLHYDMRGSGPPLVMLHGFALDLRMWDGQLDPFARHYRVLRYDLRGFGRSSTPSGRPYTHAHDLAALLDHLDIERAHVVGLSLGGGVALDFACLHPDRLTALVLVDSVVAGFPWTMSFSVRRGAADLGGYKRNWLTHDMFAPIVRNRAAYAPFARMVADYSGWHWLNKDSALVPSPPVYTRLESIGARTLAVVGEWDLPDFQAIADAVAMRVPGARKAVIAGAGHMANMEQSDAFNRLVLDFLQA